ncbi:MAG TPA: DUF433 domain-containing protein [Candidatus Thermoplasmatota archaeon]|nr:DUF433 domain-containing protein [Candidatus Thermoplasmatota archaeon]
MSALDRIVVDPAILAGKPVIRGTRVPVHLLLAMLGSGASREEVLREYPQITGDDLDAAVLYASRVVASLDWVGFGVV